MTDWAVRNWYVLWALGAGALLLAFVVYAHKHPDGLAMSLWQRLKYAAVATAVFGSMCLLVTAIFLPGWTVAVTPYFSAALFVAAWFMAPILRRWLPLERGES